LVSNFIIQLQELFLLHVVASGGKHCNESCCEKDGGTFYPLVLLGREESS